MISYHIASSEPGLRTILEGLACQLPAHCTMQAAEVVFTRSPGLPACPTPFALCTHALHLPVWISAFESCRQYPKRHCLRCCRSHTPGASLERATFCVVVVCRDRAPCAPRETCISLCPRPAQCSTCVSQHHVGTRLCSHSLTN